MMHFKPILLILLLLSLAVYPQEDEIATVSGEACTCVEKIDASLERAKRYEEIKSCISSAITTYQLEQSVLNLLEKTKDTLEKAGDVSKIDSMTIPSDESIVINTDKNYKEIETYLLQNCNAMKGLMMNESDEKQHSTSKNEEAITYYNEGQDYYRQGNFKEAIKKYKKAVDKDENFAFAWDMIGLSYRQLHQYKKAIKYYKKSLEVQPGGKVPLVNIPVAYIYLKKYKDAIQGYLNFIVIFPDDPEGYYGISRVYFMDGAYENALKNIFKAYFMYQESKSPYVRDAEQNIAFYYNELKEKGKLDIFKKVAKKYNVQIQED